MVIFVNKYHSAEPVNVVTSHGDCTPMIDKMIQSFAKRSRNTKSEASNDSPLSGLFILPIAHFEIRKKMTSEDKLQSFLIRRMTDCRGWLRSQGFSLRSRT